jgi:hypothetical protein
VRSRVLPRALSSDVTTTDRPRRVERGAGDCERASEEWPARALKAHERKGIIRLTLTIIVATTLVGTLVVKATASAWSYAVASAYSVSTSSDRQGCAHAPPLRDSALSVATFLVGCGQRLRICYGRRCVVAIRWDSGPFVPGRQIDVNVGVVRALGFASTQSFGVRDMRWTPPTARPHARGGRVRAGEGRERPGGIQALADWLESRQSKRPLARHAHGPTRSTKAKVSAGGDYGWTRAGWVTSTVWRSGGRSDR